MLSHPIGSITRHEWVDTRAVRVDDAPAGMSGLGKDGPHLA
jgi:hypothetical protein